MAIPEPTTADAIALSARHMADILDAATVVAFTATGSTAARVSRERPHSGVLGLTPRADTARRMCLYWGVRPMVTDDVQDVEDMVAKAEEAVRAIDAAASGDRVVITAGIPFGRPGKTNMIRVVRLD